MSRHRAYGPVSISFHWAIAALFLGQILLGFSMERVKSMALQFELIQWHKSFRLPHPGAGRAEALLAHRCGRACRRCASLGRIERLAAATVQGALLALTLIVPLAEVGAGVDLDARHTELRLRPRAYSAAAADALGGGRGVLARGARTSRLFGAAARPPAMRRRRSDITSCCATACSDAWFRASARSSSEGRTTMFCSSLQTRVRASLAAFLLPGPLAGLPVIAQAAADALSDAAGSYRIDGSSSIRFAVDQVGGGGIRGIFRITKGSFRIDGNNVGKSKVTITLYPKACMPTKPG